MSADGVAFLRADVERFCAELVDLRGWLTAPSATTPTTGADPGLVRRAAVGAAAGRRRRLFRQGTARRQAVHAHRAGGGADGVLPVAGAAPQGHLPVSPRGKGWESVRLPPVVGGASSWSMRMSFSHCSYRSEGQLRSQTSVR